MTQSLKYGNTAIYGQNKNITKKTYVSERTVNYLIKYISKIDQEHKWYKAIVLCSPGIGNNYTNTINGKLNKYEKGKTDENYTNKNGTKQALPIYYRNKIYTEKERENLWIEKLDKGERWILGTKIGPNTKPETIIKLIKQAQIKNKEMGYGTGEKDWEEIEYLKKIRNMKIKKRINKNSSGGTPQG